MVEVVEIAATARPRAGKGAARAVRRQGKVPAVIYGEKQEPETIAIDTSELISVLQRGRFLSTVFDINIDGQKRRVLPRDVQFDPVKDIPIHVDFQRVGASEHVRVVVPVRFINEGASPGLKRGGVLNIVRHEVEFHCPADAIPEFITVDLEGANIGDSIHISAVKLPAGVKPVISDRDFTIATIAGSSAMKPEAAADEAAPAAEGEAEEK